MKLLEYIIDSDGFYQPILFLVLAFIIYFVTAKKYPHFVWLSLFPIIAIPIYGEYKDSEIHTREQVQYLTDSMSEVYELYLFDVSLDEDIDVSDSGVDVFLFSTSNGKYRATFNKGDKEGFELNKVSNDSESLTSRKNVLEVMDLLDIDGSLEYVDTDKYKLDGDESYSIGINEKNRVDFVKDKHGEFIYKNEEEMNVEDGRELNEDDYK